MKRFEDGARVCFVGDSITHTGIYLKHIIDTYRKQFPSEWVEFYNCGISGGNLGNTIAVYDRDIAIYNPTHIVLMIGVNDSKRNFLVESERSPERYALLDEAYKQYGENLKRFYQLMRERGIELILCTPMPYAEYIESNEPPLRGGYALIQGYAEYVRNFARSRGLALCDYHAAATEQMQAENLYSPDRVHPTARGHEIMARTFLAAQGIEIESVESFSEEIEDWYSMTQRLRNVIATEYFMVSGYATMSDDERIIEMGKIYGEIMSGLRETTPYFKSLVEMYPKNKPCEAELIAGIKRVMKSGK